MKTMKKFSFWFLAALAMLAVSCDDKNDNGDGGGNGNEEVYTTLGHPAEQRQRRAIC